ncbi:MAG: YihY/virulence factor BrkB family protein [Flavobacteriales bacterium]|nr:YihY/virulence factor BrkB family protein [Flavobacteriales bacterium]MDG1395187.1 YihY/virulence factor BrkB family protein [Flavobacteriales bacterium]
MSLKEITKKISIPGYGNLSLYEVSMFFYKGLVEGAITTRASSLTFNFFLAFFPSILVLFTLIPFVPIEGFQDELFTLMSEILPPSTFDATKVILDDIVNHEQAGLLSFTFILALYFSTNGVNAMITGFNATYHLKDKRTWWQLRLLSINLTVILALLLVLTIVFQLFSVGFIDSLVNEGYMKQFSADVILHIKELILVLVLFMGYSILFYFGPADKKGWKFLSIGSITSTTLSVISSLAFSYYVTNFAQYNKLYGSIGTLLVILLWMYFNSIILLLGFELNASIISANEQQSRHD